MQQNKTLAIFRVQPSGTLQTIARGRTWFAHFVEKVKDPLENGNSDTLFALSCFSHNDLLESSIGQP